MLKVVFGWVLGRGSDDARAFLYWFDAIVPWSSSSVVTDMQRKYREDVAVVVLAAVLIMLW